MADLPPDVGAGESQEDAVTEAPDEKAYPADEPHGATVLRRLHEDGSLLMKDYDQMMGPLENEPVKAHMSKHMGYLDKHLSDTEKLFGKHYKDLPALADASGDEEEAVTEAPDEMEAETDDKEIESPDTGAGEGGDTPAAEPEEDEDEPTGEEAFAASTKGLKGKKKALKAKGKNCAACTTGKNGDEMGTDDGNLQDYEKKSVGEASGYLKELAAPDSEFGEESRFKAYHYHKTLDGIGQVQDMAQQGKSAKAGFGGAEDMAAPDDTSAPGPSDPQGDNQDQFPAPVVKDMHPARKACAMASKYFKTISAERAFGDPHRQEAGMHAEALDKAMGGDGGGAEQPPEGGQDSEFPGTTEDEAGEGGEAFEPGEMQEKLLRRAVAQEKQLATLTESVSGLLSRFSRQ
jgi:hypothetical protein